jgi:A/G-specific adenine glycosylase
VTSEQERFRARLIAWYGENRRDLPFRRTRDPYAIWVSEVMLQQTQVATAVSYYERWMERFPTLEALARAPEDAVLAAWQGLGYYSRARRLQSAARQVVERHAGKVPNQRDLLRGLPGVGDYSAGAILSIAFGQREPLVDGNVVRVLCRYFGLTGDPTRSPLKQGLWELAGELVPEEAPGDFNQALMELGAVVCTPRAPECERCPVAKGCVAKKQGLVSRLPELPERRAVTPVRAVAALVERAGKLLFRRLPANAPRFAGLWVLPHAEIGAGETPERATRRAALEHGLTDVEVGEKRASLTHTITRFRITLDAYACAPLSARSQRSEDLAWRKPNEISDLALPTPHRRLLEKIERGA